ncbi:ubiquitin-conjugating enzyme [Gregarina niphandrodes]|uniref:NEDD8 carrier protein n=1 Tax=Gregarina niphandrodes TaxID=110365 RepID=A0A023B8U3_GRENI|nr:ubiquitin-conjugating enzyme [Gregarina niphandrodes]EZG70491.1 ubiquitin-conjugating enzyme [Gregarina niphandrodes]|eukprot:XP_011129942.1 ubiquitin-conjugating enzyme [Gregarina niphandrodes]
MLRTHRNKQAQPASEKPSRCLIDPAVIRLQSDLKNIDLPAQCRLEIPNENDLKSLVAYIEPDTGYYKGGCFRFQITVPANYPHDPPKVRCTQMIFHPNIDRNGSVCLNILGVGWNPILSVYSVVLGLLDLFFHPQTEDPLNKEAANLLAGDASEFSRAVCHTMRGRSYGTPHQEYTDVINSGSQQR